MTRWRTIIQAATAVVLLGGLVMTTGKAQAASAAVPLKVVNGALVNEMTDQSVTLQGVDRAGGSYACVQGWGFTDGANDQTSIDVMSSWNVQIVRLDLDSGCWLGTVAGAYSGQPYRDFYTAYIQKFLAAGMNVVVDLQGIDPANAGGNEYPVMPDDSATTFWSQIAQTFGDDHRLIFNLYNEPHTQGWSVFKNGGTVTDNGHSYHTPGFQALVNAVRTGGFHGVILLDGESWANDFSQFLTQMPTDPDNNIAAGWHPYQGSTPGTNYDAIVGTLSGHVPVIAGEFGMGDAAWGQALFDYFAAHNVSHLAWNWNVNDGSGLQLITNYETAAVASSTHAQFVHAQYTKASPPPSCTQKFVSQGAVVLPNPAHVNKNNTIKVTFTMACESDLEVQLLFWNPNTGKTVGTSNFAVHVIANTPYTLVYSTWKPSTTGKRQVEFGVFSPDWKTNYWWNGNLGTITVVTP